MPFVKKTIFKIKKNWKHISIWSIGCICIGYLNRSDQYPEFVEENNLVTTDMLWGWGILLICYSLITIKPFWENQTDEIEKKLNDCQTQIQDLKNQIDDLEKSYKKTTESLEYATEKMSIDLSNITSKTTSIENKTSQFSSILFEHIEDCPEIYECQSCGARCEGELLGLDGCDICNACCTLNDFDRIKQSWHAKN